MILGLDLYLGLQSICVMGFRFPTMGGPLLGDPIALVFARLSLSHKVTPPSLEIVTILSLCVLPRVSNPLFLILLSYL